MGFGVEKIRLPSGSLYGLSGGASTIFPIRRRGGRVKKDASKNDGACIAGAQADQRRAAHSELKRCPESLEGYDTIYLGYPSYWGAMPI